jgi:hypothetical protein
MKTLTRLTVATALVLSAGVPAFAASDVYGFQPEAQTLNERNTYFYTQDGRQIVRHHWDVMRGGDAMAQAQAGAFIHERVNGQYFNERNAQ